MSKYDELSYSDLKKTFLTAYLNRDVEVGLSIIHTVYNKGFDMREFIKSVLEFVLDCYKFKHNVDDSCFRSQLDEQTKAFFTNSPIAARLDFMIKEGNIETFMSGLLKLYQDLANSGMDATTRIELWFILGI